MNEAKARLVVLSLLPLLLPPAPACAREKTEEAATLSLASKAFKAGTRIPAKYTADGPNVSPALRWTGVPEGTKSLALVCDDPDAPVGTWIHWVIYDIPPSSTSLPENVPKTPEGPGGSIQGVNDFKRYGYGGPCPPGGTHRYFFKIYALDTLIEKKAGLSKKKLLKEMEGHILAQGELMGTYSR